MNTPLEARSVSAVINDVKELIESSFRSVWVVGEISNLSLSSSGHWYFTLSDEKAGMSACLFKMDALRNPEIRSLRDGDKVECFGPLNVYPKRGTFQLIAKRIRAAGKGDLKEKFEALKKRLAGEGLFDPEVKKSIPSLPKRVGIITAERSAALADFLNIYERRSIWMDVTVIPALVQGDASPASLRGALHRALEYSLQKNPERAFDVIVLARGGGSLEDLWAFNDEGLAYDIFNSPIPIISAVGHQVDYSICDFVADLRCETPSAAAEVLTASQLELVKRMSYALTHLQSSIERKLLRDSRTLSHMGPHASLDRIRTMLNRAERKLGQIRLEDRAIELTGLADKILLLEDALAVLERTPMDKIEKLSQKLEAQMGILGALDPKGVLGRGYSYATLAGEETKVLASASDFDKMKERQKIDIHFHDGARQVEKCP